MHNQVGRPVHAAQQELLRPNLGVLRRP
jgi:hypothetical protein